MACPLLGTAVGLEILTPSGRRLPPGSYLALLGYSGDNKTFVTKLAKRTGKMIEAEMKAGAEKNRKFSGKNKQNSGGEAEIEEDGGEAEVQEDGKSKSKGRMIVGSLNGPGMLYWIKRASKGKGVLVSICDEGVELWKESFQEKSTTNWVMSEVWSTGGCDKQMGNGWEYSCENVAFTIMMNIHPRYYATGADETGLRYITVCFLLPFFGGGF